VRQQKIKSALQIRREQGFRQQKLNLIFKQISVQQDNLSVGIDGPNTELIIFENEFLKPLL
jgi:hypothetical protein